VDIILQAGSTYNLKQHLEAYIGMMCILQMSHNRRISICFRPIAALRFLHEGESSWDLTINIEQHNCLIKTFHLSYTR
jgi:hypothetical protein